MSLPPFEKLFNFDHIMKNLEKDIELTLLQEKMEQMKERRRVAVPKYMKKLRETDESFREKEKIRRKMVRRSSRGDTAEAKGVTKQRPRKE